MKLTKADQLEILRISGTLALICAAAALLLGFVYKFTKPLIDRNTELSTEQSLNALVNGGNESIDTYYAVGFHKIETRAKNPNGSASVRNGRSVENRAGISRIYNVYDGGQMLGYVLELTGKGYGGDMLILAYYAPDGSVKDAVVVSDSETPGIGKKAALPGYMDKFKGFGAPGKPLPQSREELPKSESDALAGATVTFKAVAAALASGAAFIAEGGADD